MDTPSRTKVLKLIQGNTIMSERENSTKKEREKNHSLSHLTSDIAGWTSRQSKTKNKKISAQTKNDSCLFPQIPI